MSRGLVFFTALLSLAGRAKAQVEFEVATVKQSAPVSGDLININLGKVQGEVVTLSNATLSECLQFAYGLVSEEQISGPDWIKSRAVRFDIVAKAPAGTEIEKLPLMLQALLTERLKVKLHHEPKTLAFLALTIGKKGAQLKPARAGANKMAVSGRISSTEMPMARLAALLSRFERQIIVDKTGLHGTYDMQLEWTPENRGETVAMEGNSLFSAVRDQLGLKLEPRKEPFDALVVDSAEKVPAEN